LDHKEIPNEAVQALQVITELLEGLLVGVYLYGSAVMGGLRVNSDVDILVVTDCSLSEHTRNELAKRLMLISGRPGVPNAVRPLEVTVVNQKEVVPWRFPPKIEFMYGEWLRDQFEKGDITGASIDPDLTILLAQLRKNSVNLFGPKAEAVFEPIPKLDIQRAMRDCLPGLIASVKGDERNVILTLARMWLTAATGEIGSKDLAAEWVYPQLPNDLAALLDQARKAYLGDVVDKWDGLEAEVDSLMAVMTNSIERYLSHAETPDISQDTEPI